MSYVFESESKALSIAKRSKSKNTLREMFDVHYKASKGIYLFHYEITENILANPNSPIDIMFETIKKERPESLLLDEIAENPSSTHEMHLFLKNDIYFAGLLIKNPSVKKYLKAHLAKMVMIEKVFGYNEF